jgi:enamine deaminase RidA (YjgF/YER057c/UK114 family)
MVSAEAIRATGISCSSRAAARVIGNRPQASTMVEMSALDGEGIEIEINAIAVVLL